MISFEIIKKEKQIEECFDEFELNSIEENFKNKKVVILSAIIKINGRLLTKKKIDLFSLIHLFDMQYFNKKKIHNRSLINSVIKKDDILNVERSSLINCECGEPMCLKIIGDCFTKIKDDFIFFYMHEEDLKVINPNLKKMFYNEKIGEERFVVLKLSINTIAEEVLKIKKEIYEMSKKEVLMLNEIDKNINYLFDNYLFFPKVKKEGEYYAR